MNRAPDQSQASTFSRQQIESLEDSIETTNTKLRNIQKEHEVKMEKLNGTHLIALRLTEENHLQILQEKTESILAEKWTSSRLSRRKNCGEGLRLLQRRLYRSGIQSKLKCTNIKRRVNWSLWRRIRSWKNSNLFLDKFYNKKSPFPRKMLNYFKIKSQLIMTDSEVCRTNMLL